MNSMRDSWPEMRRVLSGGTDLKAGHMTRQESVSNSPDPHVSHQTLGKVEFSFLRPSDHLASLIRAQQLIQGAHRKYKEIIGQLRAATIAINDLPLRQQGGFFIGDLPTVHRGFKATDSELSSNFTSSKIGSIGEKDSRQNLSRPAPINTNSERLTNDSTSSPLPERASDLSSSGYRTVETSSALDLDVEQRAGPQDFGWRRIGHLDVEVGRAPLIHRCRGFGNHGHQCGGRRGRRGRRSA